ncbi:hypothetical protein PUNSTDRAFT_122867 [Punctularia strigosozonata HHB-11173 SS5]|uniref:Uncharacterized protein n=1 Tax=Punctularia strigosozonata (strain HHB-11173) TaxID=741275 RepID=R7S3A8_PUNST|nr:uncharacterized protein PUNSTDRAFT_122867 [Punctularia strigosozonata HHB-11173 SS5]EIN04257.1 hypothetical protein PUNSTDRAFT_122867 [Punctularia strigosozonata HHB-11173 SS5]
MAHASNHKFYTMDRKGITPSKVAHFVPCTPTALFLTLQRVGDAFFAEAHLPLRSLLNLIVEQEQDGLAQAFFSFGPIRARLAAAHAAGNVHAGEGPG